MRIMPCFWLDPAVGAFQGPSWAGVLSISPGGWLLGMGATSWTLPGYIPRPLANHWREEKHLAEIHRMH